MCLVFYGPNSTHHEPLPTYPTFCPTYLSLQENREARFVLQFMGKREHIFGVCGLHLSEAD